MVRLYPVDFSLIEVHIKIHRSPIHSALIQKITERPRRKSRKNSSPRPQLTLQSESRIISDTHLSAQLELMKVARAKAGEYKFHVTTRVLCASRGEIWRAVRIPHVALSEFQSCLLCMTDDKLDSTTVIFNPLCNVLIHESIICAIYATQICVLRNTNY